MGVHRNNGEKKQNREYKLVFLFISYAIADWQAYGKFTSRKVWLCRSVWGSIINTYIQSLSCNRYKATGRSVYIMKYEKTMQWGYTGMKKKQIS